MEELKLYGGYIGMIATIVIYFFFPLRRKEIDGATSTLIKTLQDTVKALKDEQEIQKEKITKLEESHKKNEDKIVTLETENKRMLDILQGRDEDTIRFQKEGFEAMARMNKMADSIDKLVKVVESNTAGIATNNELTKNFTKTIADHFLTVEKAAITK